MMRPALTHRSFPPGLGSGWLHATEASWGHVHVCLCLHHPALSPGRVLLQHRAAATRGARGGIVCTAEPGAPPPTPTPARRAPLVLVGGLFYAALSLAGIGLGELLGSFGIAGQLQAGWTDSATWRVAGAFMLPLLASLAASLAFSDRVAALREVKEAFQTQLIPAMRRTSFLGLGALSVAAGIGEEVFFRAFLQTAVITGLALLPAIPVSWAVALGVVSTSVFFGALHALNLGYFVYATGAGCLFGAQYHFFGLTAAAITHSLYDWIALVLIMKTWGKEKTAA